MFRITTGSRAMVAAAMLFGVCAVASAGHQPDHEGERLTPEQVGGEKRMGAMLAEARTLAQRGVYDAAVRNYLHVFNYGRGVARLEIVRLALIPEEIAALGEKFPPALQALREEVRIRAGLILNNVAGTDEMLELLSLNRALHQPQRSLELYDQLKSMGERSRDTRLLLRAVLAPELLDARRFDELGDELVALARQTAERMAVLEADAAFNPARGDFLEARRASISSNAPQIYEALLSTQRDAVAEKFAEWVLHFDGTVSNHMALVSAALRAQRKEIAQQRIQRASTVLKADELADLKKLLPD